MKTLKREEIDEKYKWKLEHIFKNLDEWEKAREKSQELVEELNAKKDSIFDSPASLLSFLKLTDDFDLIFGKVASYAHLKGDENTKDSKPQELKQKLQSIGRSYSVLYSVFKTSLLSLEEEKLESFFKEEKGLLFYKKFIDELFRSKPHTLSPEEEFIMAQASRLNSAGKTYNAFTNADLVFPTVKDEKGEEIQLTQSNYTKLMESKDRSVRENVFQEFYSVFKQYENTLAATFSGSLEKDTFYSQIRKYNSSLERSLFADNVPLEVYNNLIKTVENNVPLMEKYLELRKKMLGVDELHMYDLYTPLVNLDMEIPYEEAFETVKKALAVFGDEYILELEETYNGGWIDVYPNVGKRSGAYKSGTYGVRPYILLNHKDNLNSMFTLCHELGHSQHSVYSQANNPMLYAQYSIFTAEVASTVNEVLLMRYLLENTNDKKMKQYLLTYFIEQFKSTLFRQTMFASFEQITHEKAENGQPLTAEILSDIYYNLNKKYYGDAVVHDEEIAMEWSRIPHFYNAFYVYKYATGFSAAISLSKQILEEGEPAVERYLNFLKSGGRDYPIELLKGAGVDMSTTQPIEDALEVFGGLIEELESLI
ncbi:oligoendopeptidase F [Priestia megaterium]|uniref:oligoendopeptidase F n=1 Tax=Priestia megaterium TaxID=1404 RepID=UPI0035D84847